jgi:hypothetical protein
MLTWLWHRIRFSVPGQILFESIARAKRAFDASIIGKYFYKLPKIVRVLIILIPLLAIASTPVALHYANLKIEATGRIETRRPGDRFFWAEGTTLTALDDVQLEFPPSFATDEAGVAKYLQAQNQTYTVEFHKYRNSDDVEKIIVRIKAGTTLKIPTSIGGTIAKEGDKPKRFQISRRSFSFPRRRQMC